MLQLGTAKIDITPEYPVPLAGYAVRNNRPFEGIKEKLYVRIAYFRQPDETGGTADSVIVSADLLLWATDRIAGIRNRLFEKWGLRKENILLHATHTHSGPQTGHGYHPMVGIADDGYVEWLEQTLLDGIAEAVRNLEEVRIDHGSGTCDININRRRPYDGRIVLGPNPEGPVDRELHVVRFFTADRKTKAVFAHYACHPVINHGLQVTSEFPGVAMNLLEGEMEQPGGVAMFLQGCSGDINPKPLETASAADPAERVYPYAEALAKAVRGITDGPMRELTAGPVGGVQWELPLEFDEPPSPEYLMEASMNEGTPIREWAEWMLEDPRRLLQPVVLEMTLFRLAAGLSLFTFNAEMVVFYGHFLKAATSGSILPVCYTNGTVGYVTTAEQLGQGGYEPKDSLYYFYLPAPLAPGNEENILHLLRNAAAHHESASNK